METLCGGPFRVIGDVVYDKCSGGYCVLKVFDEVPQLLRGLEKAKDLFDLKLAYASRTIEPGWAGEILTLLKYDKYADVYVIKPGDKSYHLKRIARELGCHLSEMIFFDNEFRNIHSAQKCGVVAQLVPREGMSFSVFKDGLKKYGLSDQSVHHFITQLQ